MPGLLKTGFERSVLQHNGALTVCVAAQVSGYPVRVFMGRQSRFVGVIRRNQIACLYGGANRLGMPEPPLPTFAEPKPQAGQTGCLQVLDSLKGQRAAPG